MKKDLYCLQCENRVSEAADNHYCPFCGAQTGTYMESYLVTLKELLDARMEKTIEATRQRIRDIEDDDDF